MGLTHDHVEDVAIHTTIAAFAVWRVMACLALTAVLLPEPTGAPR